MRYLLSGLLLALLPCVLPAEIYTWQAEDGTTVFSDQPQPGAKELPPPKAQTYTPAPSTSGPGSSQRSNATPDNGADTLYRQLTILKPGNDSAIRENSGRVEINVSLIPALMTDEGHYLTALIDGNIALDKTSSTSFAVSNVERGSHELVIEVRRADGETLIRSPATTFHLLRMSALFKKPAP